jgi:RNA polymerase sigma-70 factor, ECF subfamily
MAGPGRLRRPRSRCEAEDVVSECWLRLSAADARDPVKDVDAWATVAVARGALDALRSARASREVYVGPWLPEPVVEDAPADQDLADRAALDDTVSFALLVVRDTLTPAERTVWVLHDLFGMSFAEISGVVGRTPQAVRQLAARARAHVSARAPRVNVGSAEHNATVTAFLRATRGRKPQRPAHGARPGRSPHPRRRWPRSRRTAACPWRRPRRPLRARHNGEDPTG